MPDNSRPTDAPIDDAGDSPDWRALSRFLADESTADEASAVQSRLAADPTNAAFARFIEARTLASVPTPTVDVERALTSVRARIAAEGVGTAQPPNAMRPALTVERGGATGRRSPWLRGPRLAGLAAAAAVVVAIGYGTRRSPDGGSTVPSLSTSGARVHETRVGARDSVLLPDGSRVMLAPGSRLTVAANFAQSRTVQLDGAAFFEVAHDAAHPFTVRSGGTEVRDIGTAFSVNTDALGAVTVSVTDGIVAMRSTREVTVVPVELRAGDRGVLRGTGNAVADDGPRRSGASDAAASAIAVTRGTVTDEDVAWTRGSLSYRDAPLSVIQADLQRWYGIHLTVTDSALRRQTLKMSFVGDSAASAVRKIALALGAEVETRGDSVVLRMPARSATP